MQIYSFALCFFVLYGCETWSPILKKRRYAESVEEYGAEEVFGPEREELTGDCRKLCNEELHDLYWSPIIIIIIIIIISFGAAAPNGPGPPHSLGF